MNVVPGSPGTDRAADVPENGISAAAVPGLPGVDPARTGSAEGGVEVRGVSRRFNGAVALEGVDLRIGAGEFAALLGPSGSGKTTLLRILAGLDFPDAGAVRINGRDVALLPARARNIGFVPQNYALFRHMTVFENVAFGLRVRPRATRPAEREIAARARRLLEMMAIPALERRYPDQISGGQRQRVALARALAIEPAVLLLDEPFSALDAQVRKDLRAWLRGLHESLGITSVLVTHDQDEAMEIADRVAVLDGGRLVQFDAPEALLSRPASAFVAGFLGEANRLDGAVRGGMLHFAAPGLEPVPATNCADGPAVAFVRPADLLAVPAPDGNWTIRAARPDARGIRLRVGGAGEGGPVLDALPDASWTAQPRRGEPCGLRVVAAQVFPASAN